MSEYDIVGRSGNTSRCAKDESCERSESSSTRDEMAACRRPMISSRVMSPLSTSHRKQIIFTTRFITLFVVLIAITTMNFGPTTQPLKSVAAEVFGESSNDPSTTTFEDDDNEDEELNASASDDNPENESADNYLDEAYEEPEGAWASADSLQRPRWSPVVRRQKRDLDDRQILASRLAEIRRRKQSDAKGTESDNDMDNVDDGDEDAWVHDGVDDIHIDPETKRAASELSYDEKSIDADYDPHAQADQPKNRTRITTISEVIPMTSNVNMNYDGSSNEDASNFRPQRNQPSANGRFVRQLMRQATRASSGGGDYLPAAHLTLEQAEQLALGTSTQPRRPLPTRYAANGGGETLWQRGAPPGGASGSAQQPFAAPIVLVL